MEEQHKDLSVIRLRKAYECLASARLLVSAHDFKGATNRAYYAVFHAMRSVLALQGKDFAKHAGVISYFRKNYIKTGIFPIEMSKMIDYAFTARSDSDYDDYFNIEQEDIEQQIADAEIFLANVKKYVESVINGQSQFTEKNFNNSK